MIPSQVTFQQNYLIEYKRTAVDKSEAIKVGRDKIMKECVMLKVLIFFLI